MTIGMVLFGISVLYVILSEEKLLQTPMIVRRKRNNPKGALRFMEQIKIPDTDLTLCPIGLGTVGAGVKWDEKETSRILGTYLDLGGNLLDTARVYSDWIGNEKGRSERRLGDWFQKEGKRDQVLLMTKGGHPLLSSMHTPRMSPMDMRQDLELSLQALRTDVIDIYLYHRDDRDQSIEMELEVMEEFRREGKIRYYGCSNWKADRMREADAYAKDHGFRGLIADQALLNLGTRFKAPPKDDTTEAITGDILSYHKENHRNLAMAYTGLAGGYFHKYLRDGAVPGSEYDTPDNRKVAQKAMALAQDYGCTLTQLLLGYLRVQDFPCLALYGPNRMEQIREAMEGLEIPFEWEDFEKVLT